MPENHTADRTTSADEQAEERTHAPVVNRCWLHTAPDVAHHTWVSNGVSIDNKKC